MSVNDTNTTATGAPSPSVYPKRWAALWVLACGLAMIVLDGTIVGVALPRIVHDLNLDLTTAQWINSIYNVVFAALLLTTGRLGDRFGRRRLFLLGLALFVAGSVLAAASGSATLLIWARVVQGIGGAMILPGTLSTVNVMFPGEERAAAFGVWGAVMAGAAALGPLAGGVLTETLSWPWIFWVNVPIGALLAVLTLIFVPETTAGITTRGIDVDGLLTSGIAFGGLVFGLIEGRKLGVAGPIALVVGAVFLGLFLRWELHRRRVNRDRLLEFDLFRHPTFTWGNVTALMVAIGELGLILVLPLFLTNALGLGVLTVGVILTGKALGAFVSGAAARHLAARLGPASVVVLGLALELIGMVALALAVGALAPAWTLSIPLVVYGVGLGLASAQLTSTVLRDVPSHLSGTGSATQSTVRQLGAALGSAISGSALGLALTRFASEPFAGPLSDSGGAVLQAWRRQPPPGVDASVLADLQQTIAHATEAAIVVAAAFLLFGLVASLLVRRHV